ncbi:hypothetical protein [Streptomyces tropicalis]|uniref:Uncharacterized protein n=1 Tax=Streptomyces tropicalis TaxID=3034234 RepID=A0ABT6AC52_9ACTN|nr:hypothetical protein [Streptomyces tropicalis]MDF3302229.1 hypothetical protein [Streptomyces tropicalis]
MRAHTHTRPTAPATGAAGTRPPWWALALPLPAFAVLLVLVLHPAHAHTAVDPAIAQLLHRAGLLVAAH